MKKIKEYEIISGSREQKKYPLLRLEVADNFWSRFCGLMLRKPEGFADGLLLRPCNSVHMMFMRFSLDLVYLDESLRVIRIVPGLMPWLGVSWCRGAACVVELKAGTAAALGLEQGDRLSHCPR